MMISDDRAEKAVEFIRDNSARHGQLKGAATFADYKVKRARALAFSEASGTVAEREARALLSAEVEAAEEERRDAVAEETMMRDQIQAAELTIEVWRTQAANNRRGNI